METMYRVKYHYHKGTLRQTQKGGSGKKSRFSLYSRKNVRTRGSNRLQGSQMSMRQPMAPPRSVNVGNAPMEGATMPWYNICRRNHMGSYGRSGVHCFKCNEIGHYTRECMKDMLGEQSM